MSKFISSLLAILSVGVHAAEFEIPLNVSGDGERCALFLDFKDVIPDTATMKLTAADGSAIPYSFDYSYGGRRLKKGAFRRALDGYYSKDDAPAAEGQFIYPGWLSFVKKAGQNEYVLSFDRGKTFKARPDPAVRLWWVELMNDPLLKTPVKKPFYIFSGKGGFSVKSLENGGVKMTPAQGAMRLYPQFFPDADERLCGRNIVVYTVLSTQKGVAGQYGLPFGSAIRKNAGVIQALFKFKAGEKIAQYAEGIVTTDPAKFWNSARAGKSIYFWMQGDLSIHEFHMQAPPAMEGVELKFRNSYLLKGGEMIRLEATNLDREVLQPMVFTAKNGKKFGGGRAANWTGNWEASVRVRNSAGKVVQGSGDFAFPLAQLPQGDYALEAVIRAKNTHEVISSLKVPMKVVTGPQW